MGSKTLQDQIASTTDRLAKLKARELVAKARAKVKAKSDARRADAHRKIELGGLVIAAGAAGLDGAELVGALLAYQEKVGTPDAQPQRDRLRAKGAAHLAEREATRNTARRI